MPAGRPALFDSPEELQTKIEDYFMNGVTKKTVIIGKTPNQVAVQIEVPTITGLAYYLGFESRQSFYDYEKHEEYSYTIKRARIFIEKHYEEMLQSGNTVGAIFALKNFGWKDKQEIEQSGEVRVLTVAQSIEDYRNTLPTADQGDSGIPESI